MERFHLKNGELQIGRYGRADAAGQPRLVLLHGWAMPGASLLPVVTTLQKDFAVLTLDTPGNGVAPPPPGDWTLADYVDLVEGWLATLPPAPTLFVCHSFGCRLSMHLAARGYRDLKGIIVIGGHGLKPIRPWHRQLKIKALVAVTKTLGKLDRALGTGLKAKWAARVGSADYRNAGPMRNVFVRIVADDVTPLLDRVTVPVLLLYGEGDTETPPAMGARYQQLLPHGTLHILPGQDHYTVLTHGAGLVQTYLREFVAAVMNR